MSWILISLFLIMGGITLLLVAVDRLSRGWWRKLVVCVLSLILVISMRMIFSDYKTVWPICSKILKGSRDILYRQGQNIQNQIKSRESAPEKNGQYFVLGSSQVESIFGSTEKMFFVRFSDLACYEYPFFRQEILFRRPQVLILYISEYDMTRQNDLSGVKSLPNDTGYLFSLLRRHIAMGQKGWGRRFAEACLVAYENLIPEVKSGFIMRSVLNKYIALPSADVKREDGLRRKTFSSQEEFLKSIMASEEKRFGQMSFDEKNWLALEEFVSFLEKRGISVIILEGQYHPAIMSLPQAVKANGVFRDKLLLIVRRHPNIWFIPRKEQFLFSADDYKSRDWKHVEARAARRYNEYMLPLLCHRFSADAVCSNLKK